MTVIPKRIGPMHGNLWESRWIHLSPPAGTHGMPCGLKADWNDCLQFGNDGESVFVAMQLRLALKEFVEITAMLHESG